MNNWQYLLGAYSIAWLGLTFYTYINVRKQKNLERKIADLEIRS